MSTQNKRENRAGARWYQIEGHEYPSVTTILGVIGKPALIAWSAKVERELVTNVSSQLYQDLHGTPKLSPAAYLMSLSSRLGREKASQKELQKAGEIGSQAHKLIEWNLRASLMQQPGPSPQVTDKAMWAVMAWEDWKRSVNLKPIWIEQTVWSKEHGYAGRMDLYCSLDLKGLISYYKTKKTEVPQFLELMMENFSDREVTAICDWKTGKAIYAEAELQNAAYRNAFREMGHGSADLGIIVRLPKNTEDPEFEVRVIETPEKQLMQTFLHTFELWKWAQAGEEAYQAKREAAEAAKIDQQICAEVAARGV